MAAQAVAGQKRSRASQQPFAGVGRSFRSENATNETVVEALDDLEMKAVFALPQTAGVNASWFSGHAVDTSRNRQFQVVATEEACDGCLCEEGDGKTHFKLVFKEKRPGHRGVARVQATGGDSLYFEPTDAAGCGFTWNQLITGDRAERILKSYFPRLYVETANLKKQGLDADVVVNIGTLTCKQLIITR